MKNREKETGKLEVDYQKSEYFNSLEFDETEYKKIRNRRIVPQFLAVDDSDYEEEDEEYEEEDMGDDYITYAVNFQFNLLKIKNKNFETSIVFNSCKKQKKI